MQNIFVTDSFIFPYAYKFPGQASSERILFVTRENIVMLWIRRIFVVVVAVIVALLGNWLGSLIQYYLGEAVAVPIIFISFAIAILIGVGGWWWVSILWKKSLVIVTTQRLTKFIYTTPFNRHNLSLPLDMIVDTGSYTKGLLQALLRLGTFTARSSASSSGAATDDPERINKKYFYIENVAVAEDLQHYISKLLNVFRHHSDKLETFRPFLPYLKGDARKKFMEQYPEYWS